jgi:hypothetical protein
MTTGIMNRSEAGEALRRLNQARTWYERLVEKNRQAEADYREKISYLEDRYENLQKEETK